MGLFWNLADLFWFFCFLPPLLKNICASSKPLLCQSFNTCGDAKLGCCWLMVTSTLQIDPIGGWLLLFSFDYGWRRCLSILWIEWCERQCQHIQLKFYFFFGKKIVKTDTNALTNQPEIATITPPLSSRVVGCSAVVAEAEFVENRPTEVDESEIFVFGRVGGGGAKLEETEAAMTPPGELALALGVDVSSAAGGGWNHGLCWVIAADNGDDGGFMVRRALCDCAGNSKARPPDQIGRIWRCRGIF